jgi:hypothetical protein
MSRHQAHQQTLPCPRSIIQHPRTFPPQVKRVSKKVTAAIDLMVSGECKNISDAAEPCARSLSRALSKPHVAELMRNKVLRSLAMAAARAGAVKVDLMESDNAIARDRASTFVLGLAGIQPAISPTISLNLDIRAYYVIDLASQ